MGVFLASWLINALTLYLLARFLPGITIDNLVPPNGVITNSGLIAVLIGGLIMGFLNSVIKPILQLLSLPLTCLTLGLFTFVISGLVFSLAALFTPGMHVASFWWSIAGGVLFGILNSILSGIFGIKKQRKEE